MNPARDQPAFHPLTERRDLRTGFVTHRRSPMRRPPLRQGTDPAEHLYRDQVRRDAEAAHRWLAQQVKR